MVPSLLLLVLLPICTAYLVDIGQAADEFAVNATKPPVHSSVKPILRTTTKRPVPPTVRPVPHSTAKTTSTSTAKPTTTLKTTTTTTTKPTSTVKSTSTSTIRTTTTTTVKPTTTSTARSTTPSTVKSTLPPSTTSPFPTGYTDDFARQYMLPLAAAAYNSLPQRCLTNTLGHGYKLYRYREAKCDKMSDTSAGFTAYSTTDKVIVLSFRGTTRFLQIIQESWRTIFDSMVPFEGGGKVDAYFYDSFISVWRGGMRDDFLALKQKYPGYKLWLTGHSLGGSMASLCASVLEFEGLMDAKDIKLVTFGQPRTGDKNFAATHDRKFPFSFRITHNRDFVPHVPPENIPFYPFRHHKSEIWYKAEHMGEGAAYVECDADESKSCSDSNWVDASIADHVNYFEKTLSVWALHDCNN